MQLHIFATSAQRPHEKLQDIIPTTVSQLGTRDCLDFTTRSEHVEPIYTTQVSEKPLIVHCYPPLHVQTFPRAVALKNEAVMVKWRAQQMYTPSVSEMRFCTSKDFPFIVYGILFWQFLRLTMTVGKFQIVSEPSIELTIFVQGPQIVSTAH